MNRTPYLLTVLLFVLGCSVPALAQNDFRSEVIPDAGIEIAAPNRLERLPMQLGAESAFHLAKFRPKDTADYVRAEYPWYCDVLAWSKKEDDNGVSLPDSMDEETKAKVRKMLAEAGIKNPKNFEEWLHELDDVTVKTEGKKKRGKKGKLDYSHWVWEMKTDEYYSPAETYYCEAAVYDFPERQVAVVVMMPLETKGKPKSKWSRLIDAIIENGKPYAAEDDAGDDSKRDKYADEPWKKEELEKAKANIANLQGWDYFTTPNYIVFYSWDFEKPAEQAGSRKEAIKLSGELEKMRELYMQYFPLDETGTKAPMPDPKSVPDLKGPVTGVAEEKKESEELPAGVQGGEQVERLGKRRYSVFRICARYDQFLKYGSMRPGVVGWFSPASKELVVFLGGDQLINHPGFTQGVVYHEGWHQYADFYFDHPDTPDKTALHRWYDEGYAEFFGGHRLAAGGWKYYGCKDRYDDVRQMVRDGTFVPFEKIVRMDISEFYGKKAMTCYAQAQAMVDFLLRGEKSRNWDPKWGELLEMYRRTMLVKGQAKIATETAFLNWTKDDYARFTEAWKAWVESGNFLKGK